MKFERIHIELTNRCNFACKFCPDSIMTRERGDMKFSLLTKALDEISKSRLTETIMFHVMGEPLMYPNIDKAVEFAKNKGFKVCITTNGWLMTDEMLKKLLREKVDHIIFSVQTPTAQSFKLRRAEVDFNSYQHRITSCIAEILDHNSGTNATLSFLVTPFRRFILPSNEISIIDYPKELYKNFSFWIEKIANKGSEGKMTGKIKNRLAEIKHHVKKMNIIGWNQLRVTENFMLETRVLGDWIHPGLHSDRMLKAIVGCCEGLTGHFGILWNGDLVFCCVDFDGRTAFGNIGNTKILDALKRKEIQRVIEGFKHFRILHPYCQRCLGDVSLKKSLGRQLGSIFYFSLYRRWWKKKRAISRPIIK